MSAGARRWYFDDGEVELRENPRLSVKPQSSKELLTGKIA